MSRFLTCPQCGKIDNNKHVGTLKIMSCPDCCQGELNSYNKPLAGLCRDCCPTGHGTHTEINL